MKQKKQLRCTACNMGNYENKRVSYKFLGEYIGMYDALVCKHCGETLFETKASEAIEAEVILSPIDRNRLQIIVN